MTRSRQNYARPDQARFEVRRPNRQRYGWLRWSRQRAKGSQRASATTASHNRFPEDGGMPVPLSPRYRHRSYSPGWRAIGTGVGVSLAAELAVNKALLERRERLLSLSSYAGERDPSNGGEDRHPAASEVRLDKVLACRLDPVVVRSGRGRGRP